MVAHAYEAISNLLSLGHKREEVTQTSLCVDTALCWLQ